METFWGSGENVKTVVLCTRELDSGGPGRSRNGGIFGEVSKRQQSVALGCSFADFGGFGVSFGDENGSIWA